MTLRSNVNPVHRKGLVWAVCPECGMIRRRRPGGAFLWHRKWVKRGQPYGMMIVCKMNET